MAQFLTLVANKSLKYLSRKKLETNSTENTKSVLDLRENVKLFKTSANENTGVSLAALTAC